MSQGQNAEHTSTMNTTNDLPDTGLPEQLLELQGKVAQLQAAERSRARRLGERARLAAWGTAAALVVGVFGSWIGTAWSAPSAPNACNGARSNSLYCFAANQPAMAAEVNSNFEALGLSTDAVAADLAAYKVQPKPGVTGITYSDTFLQNNQSATLANTASNSVCFVGRVDVFATGAKCQANLVGSQWTGYSEGTVFCNIRCISWTVNP
jgi:hypothetical protein